MRTVQATATAVSIWITGEAVPGRTETMRLVRQALAERGLEPWPSMETECFAAGEDALVIARPGRPGRAAFFFPDLETLLGGALACADVPSALYIAAGGYVLTVPPGGAAPALWEFGEPFPAAPDWEIHAREQGQCLIGEGAVGLLRRYFAPRAESVDRV